MGADEDIGGWDAWSDDLQVAHSEVRTALADGDLQPLREYLAKGLPFDRMLREMLIELIDGTGGDRLTIKRPRGKVKPSERNDKDLRDQEIGRFVERHVRDCPGEYEAAITEAMGRWSLGRTAVTDAHAKVKRLLEGNYSRRDFTMVDLVSLSIEFPEDSPE